MIIEHISGTVGGFLGFIFGYVIGAITLSGIAETAIYAFVGGTVGFITVRFYNYVGKKLKKKHKK